MGLVGVFVGVSAVASVLGAGVVPGVSASYDANPSSYADVVSNSVDFARFVGGMEVRCVDGSNYSSRVDYSGDFLRTQYVLTAPGKGGVSSVTLTERSGTYRLIPNLKSANSAGRFVRASLKALRKPSATYVQGGTAKGIEFGESGARWLLGEDESGDMVQRSNTVWQTPVDKWGNQTTVWTDSGRVAIMKVSGGEAQNCTFSYGNQKVPKVGSVFLTNDEAFGNNGYVPVTKVGAEFWLSGLRGTIVRGVKSTPVNASGTRIGNAVLASSKADLAELWKAKVSTKNGRYTIVLKQRRTGTTIVASGTQRAFRSGSSSSIATSLVVGSQKISL